MKTAQMMEQDGLTLLRNNTIASTGLVTLGIIKCVFVLAEEGSNLLFIQWLPGEFTDCSSEYLPMDGNEDEERRGSRNRKNLFFQGLTTNRCMKRAFERFQHK